MHRSYRRVVTGHDKNGAAIIESDQVATQTLERPNRPGVRLTNFWITDQTPAEYDGPTETCLGPLTLKPPARGSVFRCVEFMPEDPEVMAQLSSGKSLRFQILLMNSSISIVHQAFRLLVSV